MIQNYDSCLNFATDAWMSPNNRAFIALSVHFENKGIPMCLLLDVVELPISHIGLNLATAFVRVLDEFGISDKVFISLDI